MTTYDIDHVTPFCSSDDYWDDKFKPIANNQTKKQLTELALNIPEDNRYQFLVSEWEEDDLIEQNHLDEWMEDEHNNLNR